MEDQKKEAKAALETLFQAAGMARLSREDHAAVQASGSTLMEFIDKCESCEKAKK